MVPRAHGGLELDLDTFLEVGLALAEGDGSMAWVTTFYIEHNWILCQFPEAFQSELYRDRSHVLAPASLAPDGVAEPVNGGYRLDGRWKWGTGLPHAEWVICGGRVERPGRRPEHRFFALPIEEVKVEDTWWVDGMCATGSGDLIVENCTVPEERSVPIEDLSEGKAPGSEIHAGPLYRTPMVPILILAAAMPAVGQARAALRRFKADVGQRKLFARDLRQADQPAAQMRLAEVTIGLGRAEDLLFQITREVMERRNAASAEERAGWAARGALAVHESREILRSIADASGASAHFRDHPLQRAVRDVQTLSGHAIFDLEQRLESYGRVLLGHEPQGLF
jgi:alkylation response protein AidB-like acyl-CoA dehydrogenase